MARNQARGGLKPLCKFGRNQPGKGPVEVIRVKSQHSKILATFFVFFLIHVRRSPFAVHRSPFTVHRSPFTVHRSPFTVHRSPFTVHRSPFTVHRSPFTVRRSPFTGAVRTSVTLLGQEVPRRL